MVKAKRHKQDRRAFLFIIMCLFAFALFRFSGVFKIVSSSNAQNEKENFVMDRFTRFFVFFVVKLFRSGAASEPWLRSDNGYCRV